MSCECSSTGTSTWPTIAHLLRPARLCICQAFGTRWLLPTTTWRSDRSNVLKEQECPNMEKGKKTGPITASRELRAEERRQALQDAAANRAL